MKIVKHIAKHDKHWIMVQTRIIYDKRLTPMALKLLLHLLICNDKEYFPTIHRIAKQFDTSSETIDRAVKTLKAAGYLESYGKRKSVIWHVWEQPKFIDVTRDAYETLNDAISTVYDTSPEVVLEIDEENNPIGVTSDVKDSKNNEFIGVTIGVTRDAPLLRNNVVCGFHPQTQQPNEENKIDELGLKCVTHSPSAATPSGQPTEMLHTSMGKEEKDNTSISEEEELRLWYYYQENK